MELNTKFWVVFFSQSGGEIVRLSKILNRVPDLIVTNKGFSDKTHPKIKEWSKEGVNFIRLSEKPKIEDYSLVQTVIDSQSTPTIITLHGYLRIIPEYFCKDNEIYNGHPGLITYYPELKGFNPQEKAFNSIEKYDKIGSVVHRVTPIVDDGEVISEDFVEVDTDITIEQVYEVLSECSLTCWIKVLNERLS